MDSRRVRERRITGLLLAWLCSMPSPAALADIYRWIDAEGRVNYGDTPPPNAGATRLDVQAVPSVSIDRFQSAQPPARDLGTAEPGGPGGVESALRPPSSPHEQRCLEARMRIAMLEGPRPVYRGEDGELRAQWRYDTYRGEREYINDLTRAAEIEQARVVVAASCAHPDDPTAQVLARKRWMMSEYCAKVRAELESLSLPEFRTSADEIERRRDMVARYCTP